MDKNKTTTAIFIIRWGAALCATAVVTLPAQADAHQSRAATAEPSKFSQKIPGSDVSFEMIPIPAGTFKMGSPPSEKDRKADEGPQVTIQVDAFYMGATAVTWDEYDLFLSNYHRIADKVGPPIPKDRWADAVTYPTPMYELVTGPALQRMGREGKFPAVIMSQFSARQYTKWLSKKTGRFYRLPTEAEWEYACRAGSTSAYGFGDDIGPDGKILKEHAIYLDNASLPDGDPAYRKVASLKPNAWGLYDMHGNVANWVIDAYAADWYKQFAGRTVRWHDAINWPSAQYPRVFRGGSYEMEAGDCRSAARHHSSKEMNALDPEIPKSPYWLRDGFSLGFRVVSPTVEPDEVEKLRYWNADDADTIRGTTRDNDAHEIVTPGKE